jgi:hypothetical protein
MIVISIGVYFLNKPEIGEHAKKVDWLPAQATDISFYKTFGYELYEFSINEKGFLKWLNKKKLSVDTTNKNDDKSLERYTAAICRDCNDTDTYVILKHGYYGHNENTSGNGGGWQDGILDTWCVLRTLENHYISPLYLTSVREFKLYSP